MVELLFALILGCFVAAVWLSLREYSSRRASDDPHVGLYRIEDQVMLQRRRSYNLEQSSNAGEFVICVGMKELQSSHR